MVIYFTGTGNSRHLARIVAEELATELVDAPEQIRSGRRGDFANSEPLVFVSPTYGWQLPHLFQQYIRESRYTGDKRAYFLMDCGSGVGGAEAHLRRLCSETGLEFMGLCPVLMPENYIALFKAPGPQEAKEIISGAEAQARALAAKIGAGERLDKVSGGAFGAFLSGPANSFFCRFIIGDKKFYAGDACNGCGLCAKSCMLNNIVIMDGRPQWQGNCCHCMACISRCPREAIEYGRSSKGRRRYHLD